MLKLGQAAIFAVASIVFIPIPCSAADRHAGYYYPAPQSQETYVARAQTLSDANRRARIAFVTGLTGQMLRNPYSPEFELITVSDGREFAHQIMIE